MQVSKLTFQVWCWLLGVLFAGNIFFVKRLVDNQDKQADKIDKQTEIVWLLRQDVTVLKVTFDQQQYLFKKLKGE